MGIHHANDREPVERAVSKHCLLYSIEMFVNQSFINDALFPVILEHQRVRGRGQRGDPAEESLDT